MKKMFRKGLSVLLAVLMVISVVPASVLTSASASAASLGYVVGDTVEFGSYPQSEVTDSALISELESLTLDWVSYGFLSGNGEFGSMTESDYMKYADVELGGEKYRAVTFTQYRPNLTYQISTEKNSNQDDNGYFTDTVYWFKFEPLKWRIIDAENGIIMSESLIDAQAYAETVYYHDNGGSTEDDYYLDSAHKTYANDYEKASLREWLNDEFYSAAFSADEKSKIMTYKADNSASDSKYDSSSTRDYVFIPSSDDVNNADMGFASDSERAATGTDYAKALGLYTPESGENSFWWLRTPGTYSYYACRVDNSGKTDEYGNSVDFTNYGVRPAIRYDFDGTGERYTATFMVDGEIYAQNSYAVGEAIVVPADPEKEGHTFKEWDTVIPATMGYEDLSFNATWLANKYTVTFNLGEGEFTDGSTQKTVTADYGSAVNCIDDVPEKYGYEFIGWFDENGNSVTFPMNVTGDITLTAHYVSGAFTVTYYTDDTVYTVQNYTYEDAITAPEAPTKAGYVFKGWSKLSGGAVTDDLGTVTGNMSFHAVWAAGETSYKVNIYQMNTLGMYSTKPSESVTLSGMTGETVAYTPEERAGFTVDSRSILSATVAGDGTTVLKVYYARNQYTLTIDGAEYILYYGATIPEEVKNVADREGLELIGFENENGERVEIPAKMPAENLTLTSVWESVYYTLTFIVDGMYTTVKYAYGDYIEAVETPTKEGYTFMGWSETEGGEVVALPDTMPASNLTYYAVWERMAIELEPGDNSEIQIIEYGSYYGCDEKWALYNVKEGITEAELLDELKIPDGGNIVVTPVIEGKIGTGTLVSLYDKATGVLAEEYTVIVLGDVDGDGIVTGFDAKAISGNVNYYTEWEWSGNDEEHLAVAADINRDYSVDFGEIHELGFSSYSISIYEMDDSGNYNLTASLDFNYIDCFLMEDIPFFGRVGETVSYTPDSADEGYYIDTEKSVLSGIITEDTQLELSVYYAREQYTIIYNIDGYEIAHKYNYGAPIVKPEDPIMEGHTFSGWTMDIPDTMPAEDLTVYATFEVNYYDVIYMVDGLEHCRVEDVAYGSEITIIDDAPTKEGYTFSGWDMMGTFTMPDEDVIVSGSWIANTDTPYTLEGYIMDTTGEYTLAYSTVKAGTTGEEISITPEELEGFTFDAEKSVISGRIAADGTTVLKLYYARNTYTVTFTVDGEVYDESVYYYGSTLVEPAQPAKENYVFAGWADADGNPAAFPITVGSDLTFTATWETPGDYSITLDANGGMFSIGLEVYTITAEYGEAIDFYETPAREGYDFYGWVNEDGEEMWIPATMPDINETWYAVWVVISYDAVFDANGGWWADGDAAKTVTAEYDAEIPAPENPTRDGYVFVGWSPAVSIMEVGGKTYVATWEEAEYTATYYVDGEVYEIFGMNYGDEFDIPADPYKEGYTFVGWTPEIPATMPAYDCEFNAVFEAVAALSITTPENALASTSNATASGIINLSDADVSLEFTEAYYLGEAVKPIVYLQYGDELFDAKKELSITYTDNNKVGTAKAVLEGLNRFSGSAELEFTISYEEIPEQIVNVTAVGDIGKILLSWGISSEVSTKSYNIYRRNEGSDEYSLIKTVNGRENLSYTDSAVEEGKTYIYYITGVGTYGAESLPSAEVYATVQSDKEGPTVFKLKPASNTTLYATSTLSITAEDNIGIAKAVYSYSEDNGATWNVIGEATGSGFACKFDTTVLGGTAVSVKVVAYDAAGNASEEVINTYKVDNIGPEKVTGLSASVQSSIVTLSWNDVADVDASYFILQQKKNGTWTTVQSNLKTRGANVENLQAETEYTFRVACVDIRGNVGEFSDEFTVATAEDTTIPAITGQTPNPARYRKAFTYTATAQDECGIASIRVQVSYDEENWTDIGTKTFTDVAKIQKYSITVNTDEYNEGYLYVRAIATDISGNESISDKTAPCRGYYIDRTAPDVPTGLKASGADGYVSLEWTVGTENDLGGYYIYRSTEEDGEYTAIMSNRAVYNYPDQTVERGKVYYYKIRVSDTCGNMSGYSEVVSAKMLDDTIKPVVRSIGQTYNNSLSASYNSFNVVASDNNMLSYMVVEYCTTKNMAYAEAARAESIADTYKNISVKIPMDGLESGDKVYVRAYAVDVMGLKSDYVNAQYTVDLTAPSASDFKAAIVNSKVTLTWNDCGEADLAGFKVYHSANGKDYTLVGSRGISSSGTYSFIHYINTQQSGTYFYKLVPLDKLQNGSELITSVEYTYIAPPEPDPEEEEPPVIIVNEAPVASFTCKPFMILDVEDEFNASASTDDSEITEYIWDFGDGTSSTEIKPIKKYSAVGTYTVTLTVKDAEGLQHSVTQSVEVKEREKLGTLKVRVVDENGSAVAYAPVYFDLGTKDMKEVRADSSGVATMLLPDGTHKVGAYKDHYLPAKKEIVVLPNATRTITLTIVKGDIITGEFEITRMTFDEIVAAGIDPYDPDNRLVYSATVRLTYGTTPININYYRNNSSILSYTVSDSNTSRPSSSGSSSSYTPPRTFKTSDGEERKIVNVTYIGGDNNNDDVVAILDVPAQASYLKEFFDVKLHIVNNAASDFVMKNNEIKLNVPEGMTLMTGLSGGYQNSDTVYIDSIKGQNTVTISWCLRGDVAGEYDLTADYTGILDEFEELVTTTFKTEEPIKVYGLDGVKFRILGADEIHNDTLYFNVELENERDVDLLLPDISVIDSKVYNITDRVLLSEREGGGGFDTGSFDSTVYLLNVYVQLEDGAKQYLPIVYGENGNLTANLELLAPGQKLVHEYVAYNAINYDGIAYFKDAAIIEFEGLLENIEVGSFTKERYSYTDFSEKFNNIYSGSSQEIIDAYMYVNGNSNYYYYSDAELATDGEIVLTEASEAAVNTMLSSLYYLAPLNAVTQPMNPLTFKLLLDRYSGKGPTQVDINTVELKGLSSEDERKLIKNELLKILTSESITDKVMELEMVYNYNTVKKFIGEVESGIKQLGNADDVAVLSIYWASQIYEYTTLFRQSGKKALYEQLKADVVSYCGDLKELCQETSDEKFFKEILGLDVNEMLSKVTDLGVTAIESVFDAYAKTQEDAYYQAMVHYHCNNEVAKTILNALINVTQNTEIATNVIIADVASEFLENIEKSEEELKDLTDEFLANYAKDLASEIFSDASKAMLNNIIKFAFGTTIAGVVSLGVYVIKYILNEVINVDNHNAQEDALIIYARLSDAFSKMFRIRTPGTEFEDFTSMVMLMGLCELRLAGEAQYKRFMQEYIDGVYPLGETTEEEVMEKLNAIKNTKYNTLAEWYDTVQYNIVNARDILFNIESTATNIPSAPTVTLDYENCQTVQPFGEEYEYCFGDGVWMDCKGEPIEFELDTVPQTLRVRVAASDTNLAGEITTVRIYAQKELSKLITVRYDGEKYIFSNLTSERAYEMVLLNTSISSPDWDEAMYISGGEISCETENDYIALRSRPSDSLLETYSIPLVLKVQKKQPLDLTIKGDGTVEQSNTSGEYFVGDIVDLIATPHTGCEFLGWYVDGELVSEDVHYILEFAEDLEVKAEFTGVTVKSIEIESMPSKTVYTVGETLSTDGMTLKVKYSDFTSKVIDSGFVCSESVFAKDGETTVTVTYGGATAEFTVNVYKEYYILTWVIEGETAVFEMKYGEVLDFEITMDRPGYIFTGWTPEVPLTMPAHDVTLTATFEPETYDAIFDANGGVFADGSTDITVPVDYDAQIVAPAAPEKQGYLFAGWSYNGKNLGENLGVMNSVGGMVFKAEWIAATDTVYTVETYTMDTTGEYVLSTQLLSGTTGETVTAEPSVSEGFEINAEKSVLSGIIAGDSSLVLKVYIDRLAYTLTVDNGSDIVSGVYYYGAIIAPVETPEKTGYTFNGWDNEFPATMPAKDVTITAVFEANTYDAVFMNGNEAFATVSVKYDEKITAPEGAPEKENYTFIGWSLDGIIIVSDLGTMDETGKTFYAVWQAYAPDHEHVPYTVTIDATCTVDGMEYTICLECGETIGDAVVIPALNHSETQTVTVSESCTVAGMKYDICVFCGETVGEPVVVPASGHKAGEWETVKSATCTENGEQIKKCTVCGEALETGVVEASGHKAGEWETVKSATCTENGEQIKKCTVCGETLETGVIEASGHKAGEWETSKNATCTENGGQIKKCTVCGETLDTKVIKAKGHTPAAEWTTVLEPTAEAEGKKIKKCLVCGKTAEESAISKLESAVHEDTDIAIEYQPDDYDGNVSINVEETFDGGAFNVVNTQTGSAKTQIYDITMTVDGVETQPEGKVTVRIPLPAGYNPQRSFVYHVDTKTGKVEKMNSRHENGYLVFETDHFSYYAVVDESQAGTAVNAVLSIKQPSVTTVKYGDTLILHAEIKGEISDGASIEWSTEGEGMTIKPSEDGKTCAVTSTAKGDATVTAKLVDKNGNALNTADGSEISAQQKLTSKAGFFQKLISFFKNLFRMNRIIEQVFKSIF